MSNEEWPELAFSTVAVYTQLFFSLLALALARLSSSSVLLPLPLLLLCLTCREEAFNVCVHLGGYAQGQATLQ